MARIYEHAENCPKCGGLMSADAKLCHGCSSKERSSRENNRSKAKAWIDKYKRDGLLVFDMSLVSLGDED